MTPCRNNMLKLYIGYGRVRHADSRGRRGRRMRYAEYSALKSFDYLDLFARRRLDYFKGWVSKFTGDRGMIREWEDIMEDILDKMIPKLIRELHNLSSKFIDKGQSVDHGAAKRLGKMDEDIMDAFADWMDEYDESGIESGFPVDQWEGEVRIDMRGTWVGYMRHVRYNMVEKLNLGSADDVERAWKKHIRKYDLHLPEYDIFKSSKFVSRDV